MNIAQRKLTAWFCVIIASLTAAATAILAYTAYQLKLAHYGDIFDRIVADRTLTWVDPALICLAGAFLMAVVLFVGFWRFFAGEGGSRARTP